MFEHSDFNSEDNDAEEPIHVNFGAEKHDKQDKHEKKFTNDQLAQLETEREILDEDEISQGKRLLKESLVPSIWQIADLALNASNERVRLAASQYIIDRNLGKPTDHVVIGSEDPFEKLLAQCVTELDIPNLPMNAISTNSSEIPDEP